MEDNFVTWFGYAVIGIILIGVYYFLYVLVEEWENYMKSKPQQPKRRTGRNRTSSYSNHHHHYYHYNNRHQDEDEPTNFIDNNSYSNHHEYTFQDEEYNEYWSYEEDEDEKD